MRKITNVTLAFLLSLWNLKAQTSQTELNGYVDMKNVGGTGFYTLSAGIVEGAAQTYYYSGPGRITGARVYGNYPGTADGVPLKISVYNVGANNRPTTAIQSVNKIWRKTDNILGYIDVVFGVSGIPLSGKFAIVSEIVQGSPFGNSFQLKYTGDGEGRGEDLASLEGASTGFNWVSAKNTFNKDGDFYLIPKMRSFITSNFSVASTCVNTGDAVFFTNLSLMSQDSMFNQIGLSSYLGSNHFYTWNFGDGSPLNNNTSPSHVYSSPGVYTVTLTNSFAGWDATVTNVKTIRISVGLSASATITSSPTCNGLANGTIKVTGSAGMLPYTFSLNGQTFQADSIFTGLAAGSYTVFVYDSLKCKDSTTFVITQPSAIHINSVQTTNAACGSSNGALLISASGDAIPLTFQINNGSFQSSGSFTNLPSGINHIVIKDANGCIKDTIVAVNSVTGPTITSVSFNSISCNGGNDGAISVTSTGGVGAPAYSINGINFQSTGIFSNLPANVYVVTVKDAAGCIATRTLTLVQPSPLTVAARTLPVSCYGDNNGSIHIANSIGGIGSRSYSINGVNYQSGTVFAGLMANTYTVYVKDIAGCVGSTNVIVRSPEEIIVNVSGTNVNCFGGQTGAINVSASGGTGMLSYNIDRDNFQPTGQFTELSAGIYRVVVKDENNCTGISSFQINEGDTINAIFNSTNSTCGNSNGAILVIGNGGTGADFMYSIDGTNFQSSGLFSSLVDSTYFITVKDSIGCKRIFNANVTDADGPVITAGSHTNVTCPGGNTGTITITSVTGGSGTLLYSVNGSPYQTSGVFNNLEAGNNTVIVKDGIGCSGDTVITLTEPNRFTILSSVTNVACNGDNTGSVIITAVGGSGTLTYNINEGTFQSSNSFTGLPAGNYEVSVKDAGGCRDSALFAVVQPRAITVSAGVFNVACNGNNNGSIIVNASGGTGTLMYSINGINYQGGNIFNGLSGGPKTVYVKDANNCVDSIIVNINEPAVLTLSKVITNVSCFGGNDGAVDLTVSGGSAPYTVLWNNDSQSQDITNLTAGTYSVNVFDNNGCNATTVAVVTGPSAPLVANGIVTNASGAMVADGMVNLTVSGGTPSYSYSWSNGATTQDLSNIIPGTYSVTITDAKGCTTSASYTVSNAVGITNINSNSSVLVYPNPAVDIITVESSGTLITNLKVLNVLGQILIDQFPKNEKVLINTSNFESGVYFIQIISDNKVTTKRIRIIK